MISIARIEKLLNQKDVKFKDKTKVVITGDIIKIQRMTNWSNGINIRKLSAYDYLNLNTGEIKQFAENAENRSESKQSLMRTFELVRDTINANIRLQDVHRVKFITPTYKENMTDPKKLYVDLKIFIKKLKKHYGQFEYITVVEPQGRGAWHAHILLIFPGTSPYMKYKQIIEMWGNGRIDVQELKNCDNVGAYLTAYLGDVSLDKMDKDELSKGQYELKDVEIKGKTKKYVKGGRLHMYPPGMNILRCSRGIEKPIIEIMPYKKAQKKVSAVTPTYETGFTVDTGEQKISILKQYYNINRPNGKL